MAVTIHLPGPLSAYAGGARRVVLDTAPASVGEALAGLGARACATACWTSGDRCGPT
jgi:hypothetical protein